MQYLTGHFRKEMELDSGFTYDVLEVNTLTFFI